MSPLTPFRAVISHPIGAHPPLYVARRKSFRLRGTRLGGYRAPRLAPRHSQCGGDEARLYIYMPGYIYTLVPMLGVAPLFSFPLCVHACCASLVPLVPARPRQGLNGAGDFAPTPAQGFEQARASLTVVLFVW